MPHPARILLVEDDATLLGLTEAALVEAGYDVQSRGDARDALALMVTDRDIDLLITDMSMPWMNGDDLARAVRRLAPGRLVLYVTGHDVSSSVSRTEAASARRTCRSRTRSRSCARGSRRSSTAARPDLPPTRARLVELRVDLARRRGRELRDASSSSSDSGDDALG